MSAQERAAAVREAAGLFRPDRGLIRVGGGDRVRWLDGMLSNDVTALHEGPQHSGCYAAVLTRQGRIVSDLHVLLRGDAFWLDAPGPAVGPLLEHLDRFIIADDVVLEDAGAAWARLAVEGPAAPEILAAACGEPPGLAAGACREVDLAGAAVVLAAFGWSGEPAFQLYVPVAAVEPVGAALRRAGGGHGLVEGDAAVLEILRIEAGVPRYGAELGPDVLPAEARLERAVSTTKGCYTGQEVVARMASRDQVSHLLVGLRLPAGELPAAGAEIRAGEKRVGELTSACLSPAVGAVALGFVRRAHAAAGAELAVDGRPARVAELPFLRTSLASGSLRGLRPCPAEEG